MYVVRSTGKRGASAAQPAPPSADPLLVGPTTHRLSSSASASLSLACRTTATVEIATMYLHAVDTYNIVQGTCTMYIILVPCSTTRCTCLYLLYLARTKCCAVVYSTVVRWCLLCSGVSDAVHTCTHTQCTMYTVAATWYMYSYEVQTSTTVHKVVLALLCTMYVRTCTMYLAPCTLHEVRSM